MIAAVMPAKGRTEATAAAITRLYDAAGYNAAHWRLIVVVDDDPALYRDLAAALAGTPNIAHLMHGGTGAPVGYWHCLARGIRRAAELDGGRRPDHVVNLANDLLPGMAWLSRMVDGALQVNNLDGVNVFNDGIHVGASGAHFLASTRLLYQWYGSDCSPTMYRHMFGDTEITERAKAAGKFWANPWSVLYHNHAYVGAGIDEVYKLGHASTSTDKALFERRRAAQWRME